MKGPKAYVKRWHVTSFSIGRRVSQDRPKFHYLTSFIFLNLILVEVMLDWFVYSIRKSWACVNLLFILFQVYSKEPMTSKKTKLYFDDQSQGSQCKEDIAYKLSLRKTSPPKKNLSRMYTVMTDMTNEQKKQTRIRTYYEENWQIWIPV